MTQQGFYSDLVGRRFAYDADGTTMLVNGSSYTMSAWGNLSWNSDQAGQFAPSNSTYTYTFMFPELRDINAFFWFSGWDPQFGSTGGLQFSTNTTTGSDGTWTSIPYNSPNYHNAGSTYNGYWRNNTYLCNYTGVKAVQFYTGGYFGSGTYTFHMYGKKSVGQTPHRLSFCDYAGNDYALDEDYGDQPRASVRTWSLANTYNESSGLYIKNISTQKTANNVALSIEAPWSDMGNSILYSTDNVTFSNTINYTAINPTQIVGPIYVKYSPSGGTSLGLKSSRMKLTVVSWT